MAVRRRWAAIRTGDEILAVGISAIDNPSNHNGFSVAVEQCAKISGTQTIASVGVGERLYIANQPDTKALDLSGDLIGKTRRKPTGRQKNFVWRCADARIHLSAVKLLSWNVNGIRSVLGKGFGKFLAVENPDILCLQETRTASEPVAGPWDGGWHTHWSHAEKKGYSGTAVLTREKPLSVVEGIGRRAHGLEGRAITCEFPGFYVVNLYVPNAQRELTRLDYRMQWDRDLRAYLRQLDKVKPVLVCGDFNVAHEEIDIARPRENRGNSGFTDEERASFTRHLKAGFVDTFRAFEPGPGHYSWWTFRAGARKKNIGWRIDYWLASERLRPAVKRAFILSEVTGSDHCPVGIELDPL